MDIIEAIKDRQSTRAFLKTKVSQKTIQSILDIAKYAPSGANTQPWFVVAVTGDIQKKIGQAIVKAKDAGVPENPDYQYYPTHWRDPYKKRRKDCGLALYKALQIAYEDKARRLEAWYKNYYFFDAPVGLLFFLDNDLEKGSWMDMGMFIQNVMLAARSFGLDTCPQASLAEYPDIVREILGVPKEKILLCGMALGYKDKEQAVNQYHTERDPVDVFSQFLGFDSK
jgi:nitroreductase